MLEVVDEDDERRHVMVRKLTTEELEKSSPVSTLGSVVAKIRGVVQNNKSNHAGSVTNFLDVTSSSFDHWVTAKNTFNTFKLNTVPVQFDLGVNAAKTHETFIGKLTHKITGAVTSSVTLYHHKLFSGEFRSVEVATGNLVANYDQLAFFTERNFFQLACSVGHDQSSLTTGRPTNGDLTINVAFIIDVDTASHAHAGGFSRSVTVFEVATFAPGGSNIFCQGLTARVEDTKVRQQFVGVLAFSHTKHCRARAPERNAQARQHGNKVGPELFDFLSKNNKTTSTSPSAVNLLNGGIKGCRGVLGTTVTLGQSKPFAIVLHKSYNTVMFN
mmetsp:Transcript_14493/g.20552  ORF Transcript_14493/g.20552 Transcript_14493/m.20552 type:complete len:329 (-) Transcript_14493:2394-3380(-)